MPADSLSAAAEQINAGAPVATIESSLLEHVWKLLSSLLREHLEGRGVGLHAVTLGDSALLPQQPEQQIALSIRYVLLKELIERGVLADYMSDDSSRKKVFAAAASFPCDKDDLGEALAQRVIRNSPPETAAKTQAEFRRAGIDPDHPGIDARFIEWMNANC